MTKLKLPNELDQMLKEASGKQNAIHHKPFKFRIEREGTFDVYSFQDNEMKDLRQRYELIRQNHLAPKWGNSINSYLNSTGIEKMMEKPIIKKIEDLLLPLIEKANNKSIIDIKDIDYGIEINERLELKIKYTVYSSEYIGISININANNQTIIHYIEKSSHINSYRHLPTNKIRLIDFV